MKNKQVPTEKILDDIYHIIAVYVKNIHHNTTVESFLRKYKYFHYMNTYLFFHKEMPVEHAMFKDNYVWSDDSYFISIEYTFVNNNQVGCKRPIQTYKRVFPYLRIFLRLSDSIWCSDVQSTKLLMNSFPTRKNIITNLLKEL